MPILGALLQRPEHRDEAARALSALVEIPFSVDLALVQEVDATLGMLQRMRFAVPDDAAQLSVIDQALLPLMVLHRATFMRKPIEDQLEPSEQDLPCYGVTLADFEVTAEELGFCHLGVVEPSADLSKGMVVGTKKAHAGATPSAHQECHPVGGIPAGHWCSPSPGCVITPCMPLACPQSPFVRSPPTMCVAVLKGLGAACTS